MPTRRRQPAVPALTLFDPDPIAPGAFSALVMSSDPVRCAEVAAHFDRFPAHLRALMVRDGYRTVVLAEGERYADRSRALRDLGENGVDHWPVPPAGLFVIPERTLYLRSTCVMTVVHELGHALDCALGGGYYRSATDARLRAAFRDARAFVTPYAASGIDEYFAEGVRAMLSANSPGLCPWPDVSPERLAKVDPALFALLSELFTNPAVYA
jgi:hypothetical protein